MLAVIDYRTDHNTINKLSEYVDEIYLFRTEGITYNSISCHPDIFIYQDDNGIIAAPNIPSSLIETFRKYYINFSIGNSQIGETIKSSTGYNCFSTDKYFFHRKGFTENKILAVNEDKIFINLPQAYTRCSLIHLADNNFITSDIGIKKIMDKNNLNCFYFDPSEINIIDHRNGFIGGTSGVFDKKIFFNGNINMHNDGNKLMNFINNFGIEIISLGNHRLYDGGGIFFIN